MNRESLSLSPLSYCRYCSPHEIGEISYYLVSPRFSQFLPVLSLIGTMGHTLACQLTLSLCVCVCVCVWAQLLSHVPRTVAHQAPLSMEFSRQASWSGLPFPSPQDLPDSGIELESLASPVWAGGFFTTVPPGKPDSVTPNKCVLKNRGFTYWAPLKILPFFDFTACILFLSSD